MGMAYDNMKLGEQNYRDSIINLFPKAPHSFSVYRVLAFKMHEFADFYHNLKLQVLCK